MPSLFEPQVAEEIKQRINDLQSANKKLWGKMTVAQMLHHCTEAMGTGTDDTILKVPFLMKIFAPLIKKKVMENKPYKPGLPTAKEFVIKDDRNFEEEKSKILAMIDKFIANKDKMDGKRHPAFGVMTNYEWGFSQWKHLDHHLKQFSA